MAPARKPAGSGKATNDNAQGRTPKSGVGKGGVVKPGRGTTGARAGANEPSGGRKKGGKGRR